MLDVVLNLGFVCHGTVSCTLCSVQVLRHSHGLLVLWPLKKHEEFSEAWFLFGEKDCLVIKAARAYSSL